MPAIADGDHLVVVRLDSDDFNGRRTGFRVEKGPSGYALSALDAFRPPVALNVWKPPRPEVRLMAHSRHPGLFV